MDMHITENDFPDISKTVEILATNFIKGVLNKEWISLFLKDMNELFYSSFIKLRTGVIKNEKR